MDYFADDTKSKGKIYMLISNYFQDAWSEKQQSIEFLVLLFFWVNICTSLYTGFQVYFFIILHGKHAHIFH